MSSTFSICYGEFASLPLLKINGKRVGTVKRCDYSVSGGLTRILIHRAGYEGTIPEDMAQLVEVIPFVF